MAKTIPPEGKPGHEQAEPAAEETTEEESVDTEALQAYVDGLNDDELAALKKIVDEKTGSDAENTKMTMADFIGEGTKASE